MPEVLGTTLVLEVKVADKVYLLKNIDFWKDTLKDIITMLGMTYIDSCGFQFKVKDSNEDGGVSVVAILLESHLSVHTWPEYEYFHMVLDCCKEDIDYMKLYNHLEKLFGGITYKANRIRWSNDLRMGTHN